MAGPEHLQRWTGDRLTGSEDWLRHGEQRLAMGAATPIRGPTRPPALNPKPVPAGLVVLLKAPKRRTALAVVFIFHCKPRNLPTVDQLCNTGFNAVNSHSSWNCCKIITLAW